MLTLNPYGTVQEQLVFRGGNTIYKEECTCDNKLPKHWNIVHQTKNQGIISERVIIQSMDEALVDYAMAIMADEELLSQLEGGNHVSNTWQIFNN